MILFLYGEDSYRSREKLNQIKAKFKEKDKQGLNLSVLKGEFDFSRLQDVVRQSPFLGKTRLIVLENVFQNKKTTLTQVARLLQEQKIPDSTVLVFWEEGVPDRRNKLFQCLVQKAQCEEFAPLAHYELNQWIRRAVLQRGGMIEPRALRELILRVGNDLYQMTNEIDKLLAYSEDKKIRLEMVKDLVKAKFEADIFKLVDALSHKDRSSALKFIQDQITLGANELYLLTMIIYAFRNLLVVKDLAVKGLDQRAIIQETRLHSFVVKKNLASATNFSLEDLKKIYAKLLDLDLKIKTGAIGADFGLSMLVFGVT